MITTMTTKKNALLLTTMMMLVGACHHATAAASLPQSHAQIGGRSMPQRDHGAQLATPTASSPSDGERVRGLRALRPPFWTKRTRDCGTEEEGVSAPAPTLAQDTTQLQAQQDPRTAKRTAGSHIVEGLLILAVYILGGVIGVAAAILTKDDPALALFVGTLLGLIVPKIDMALVAHRRRLMK